MAIEFFFHLKYVEYVQKVYQLYECVYNILASISACWTYRRVESLSIVFSLVTTVKNCHVEKLSSFFFLEGSLLPPSRCSQNRHNARYFPVCSYVIKYIQPVRKVLNICTFSAQNFHLFTSYLLLPQIYY